MLLIAAIVLMAPVGDWLVLNSTLNLERLNRAGLILCTSPQLVSTILSLTKDSHNYAPFAGTLENGFPTDHYSDQETSAFNLRGPNLDFRNSQLVSQVPLLSIQSLLWRQEEDSPRDLRDYSRPASVRNANRMSSTTAAANGEGPRECKRVLCVCLPISAKRPYAVGEQTEFLYMYEVICTCFKTMCLMTLPFCI